MKSIAVLVALLAGCSMAQPRPTYSDGPKLRQCKFEAQKAVVTGNSYGGRTLIVQMYGDGLVYRDVLDACMAQY